MQVDNEVEPETANFADYLANFGDGTKLIAVTQLDTIDGDVLISHTGEFCDLDDGRAHEQSDLRTRESIPHRSQRRQADYNIAKLAEVDY